MAKVGAQRAAELTGRSKSTIQRAMNNGKLSFEVDGNGRRLIDVSELDRAFGLEPQGQTAPHANPASSAGVDAEIKRAADMIEMERLRMKIKAQEDQMDLLREQMEDLKNQRDQWQKQAQQVLITSHYSQQQAEELKEEIRQRDERARALRQKALEDRMKKMKGQNENQQAAQAGASAGTPNTAAFDFQSLWAKIKGGKAA
ncbi:MAG: entry exclusion 1 domain-containing protein [Alphaproteobacteria bacterium]|nr:entry exclusion 1 domain-containing protein [Alphaproteobacteria bacterium]